MTAVPAEIAVMSTDRIFFIMLLKYSRFEFAVQNAGEHSGDSVLR